jgi:hypothetical protein
MSTEVYSFVLDIKMDGHLSGFVPHPDFQDVMILNLQVNYAKQARGRALLPLMSPPEIVSVAVKVTCSATMQTSRLRVRIN